MLGTRERIGGRFKATPEALRAIYGARKFNGEVERLVAERREKFEGMTREELVEELTETTAIALMAMQNTAGLAAAARRLPTPPLPRRSGRIVRA